MLVHCIPISLKCNWRKELPECLVSSVLLINKMKWPCPGFEHRTLSVDWKRKKQPQQKKIPSGFYNACNSKNTYNVVHNSSHALNSGKHKLMKSPEKFMLVYSFLFHYLVGRQLVWALGYWASENENSLVPDIRMSPELWVLYVHYQIIIIPAHWMWTTSVSFRMFNLLGTKSYSTAG